VLDSNKFVADKLAVTFRKPGGCQSNKISNKKQKKKLLKKETAKPWVGTQNDSQQRKMCKMTRGERNTDFGLRIRKK